MTISTVVSTPNASGARILARIMLVTGEMHFASISVVADHFVALIVLLIIESDTANYPSERLERLSLFPSINCNSAEVKLEHEIKNMQPLP